MIGYYLAIGLGKLLSRLPFPLLYFFSDFLTFLMESIIRYRRDVIMDNLQQSFPDKSPAELQIIRKAFYRNFSDILVEAFKSLHLSAAEMRRRFKLRNPELFEKLYRQKKGVIMVMGHFNNFEWTAMGIPLCVPQPCFAVYHPLNHPHFSRKIVEIREQFGLKLFPMAETYPFMLNNPAEAPLYVFMADQSPHKGKIKYRTPFLHRLTPVHLGVENLSRQCDLAVVFIATHRVRRGYYEVEAELLFEDVQEVPQYEVTRAHVAALEKQIIKTPEAWLWSHKRWKHA